LVILFFADVVGRPGRDLLCSRLQELRETYGADAVIVNGENSASGAGITPGLADQMFRAGADVITTGNHVWKRREIYPYIDQTSVLLRPYNYLSSTPGRGLVVVDTEAGRLGVVSLSGLLYMEPARSPFEAVEEALSELHGVRHVLVDFHAEATSEKVAMGHHLDGRVSGVIGTHTHVRTADARVLPQGTAYITDAGMCGARDSVIGVKKERALERFLTQMPVRFEVADNDVWLEGVVLRLGEQGRAREIEPFAVQADPVQRDSG